MRAPFTLSQFCPGGISHPGKPTSLPGIAKELLPAGAGGDQFPGDPRWLSGHAGPCVPLPAPPAGQKFVLNPCRKAHRNYSLFPIHYSLSTRPAWRHTAPRQTHLLSGNARELLPAGALSPPGHGPCPGCVRVSLACPQILSANCSPQGQGASLFHGDMIK